MQQNRYFKEQIFVFPVGDDSNESIAKHPSMVQVEPDYNAECFVGKNKIVLPVYPIENMVYIGLKKTKVAFYAFILKEKDGHRQYFHSQNVKQVAIGNQSALAQKLLDLIKNRN